MPTEITSDLPNPGPTQNPRWRKVLWSTLVILMLARPLWHAARLCITNISLDYHWPAAVRDSWGVLFAPAVFVIPVLTFLVRRGLQRGWYGCKPPVVEGEPDPRWRKVLWVGLVVVLVMPLYWLGETMVDSSFPFLVEKSIFMLLHPSAVVSQAGIESLLESVLSVAVAPAVSGAVAWLTLCRGWYRQTGQAIASFLGLALLTFIFVSAFMVQMSSQGKCVLCNVRQLSAAADQYFLEYGSSTVAAANLIGATNYVKALNTVAHETYPEYYTQGITITVTGIAGFRTVTYSP